MKIKRLPEDFRVVELSRLEPTSGTQALYRLAKTGLGTLEAVSAIARHWRIARGRIGFGGLKDRHAVTEQFLTIDHGPARGLTETNLRLEYLGQVDRPFTAGDISGNRFEITLRGLDPALKPTIDENLRQVARDGVPNYFDEQRFGSLGNSGAFVARAWCGGDWERTLWLALVDPNVHDSPRVRQQKQLLADHWGNWRGIAERLESPATESDEALAAIVRFLVGRPGDFRGAIARIDVDQRGLYLSSFQSHLWNRILAALVEQTVEQTCDESSLTRVSIGPDSVPFFHRLDDRQRELLDAAVLPLPSSRLHLAPGPITELVEGTLCQLGLELRQLRVKYPRDSFFSKGERPALSHPRDLASDWSADELDTRRAKVSLRFQLPRGSYATIVVKRLTEVPGS